MESKSKSKKKSGESSANVQRRVGLLYDERMCRHHTLNNEEHVENPNRITSIWNHLESVGIPQR